MPGNVSYIGEGLSSTALPPPQKMATRRRGATRERGKMVVMPVAPKACSSSKADLSEEVPLPPYKVITHSLKYEWVLWGLNDTTTAVRSHEWDKKLRELGAFDTVEDFWLLFDSVPAASDLGPNRDYLLFKRGVMPRWEDPANKRGGKWIATLGNRHDESKTLATVAATNKKLDAYWMEVVKACVGAQFGAVGNEDVCGAVVSVRANRPGRVALWIRDAREEQRVIQLGSVFKEKVNRVPSTSQLTCYFENHPVSK